MRHRGRLELADSLEPSAKTMAACAPLLHWQGDMKFDQPVEIQKKLLRLDQHSEKKLMEARREKKYTASKKSATVNTRSTKTSVSTQQGHEEVC